MTFQFEIDWLSRVGQVRAHVHDGLLRYSPALTGDHPNDWRVVYQLGLQYLWKESDTQPRLTSYMQYIEDIAPTAPWMWTSPMWKALQHNTTPVAMCHGNLILSNVVGETFINPRPNHGMCVREMDEAGLLKSIMGWEQVLYGHSPPLECGMPYGPATLALFMGKMLESSRYKGVVGEWAMGMANWARQLL